MSWSKAGVLRAIEKRGFRIKEDPKRPSVIRVFSGSELRFEATSWSEAGERLEKYPPTLGARTHRPAPPFPPRRPGEPKPKRERKRAYL